jgi:transcriptional/translational regulatory protein YebC/TACO1
MEAALDAGADDVQRDDSRFVVSTSPTDFHTVQTGLKAKNVAVEEAELAMVPKTTVRVNGKDAESLLKLLETIEDLDDVQKVWANFDIDVEQLVAGG